MIEIIRAEDISEEQFKNQLEVYTLKEDDHLLLTCAFRIVKKTVEYQDIAGTLEDKVLLDAIVRAVASYAQGKGASNATCRNRALFATLLPLGFEDKDRMIQTTTAHLLRHQCCGEGIG